MEPDLSSEEIAALLHEVRERVRARYPAGSEPTNSQGAFQVPLPNLLPILHARDAAQAKMAAIGSVNPRQGGPLNAVIQGVKRTISRALGWFVRDQITFNRQMVASVEAILEALNEANIALGRMTSEAQHLHDMRVHWEHWREEWENSLRRNEILYLRGIADLQNSYQQRLWEAESGLRKLAETQHGDFRNALDRTNMEIQQRVWNDLERFRLEYDRMIQTELRLIRQRLQVPLNTQASAESPAPSAAQPALSMDYARFAERFRGSDEYVRVNQRFYLPYFEPYTDVLDIGCGRGEFLEVLRESGIPARGIELSDELVALCRNKGLEVERADLFEYLGSLPEGSGDAIFSAQVVEHIEPARLPDMVRLCASRVRRGGLVAFETPNPECLAIFATHFYLDPTHQRPVPHPLLSFYMEEAGLGRVQVHKLAPATESFPELVELPKPVVERFFGGLDYAILGWKL